MHKRAVAGLMIPFALAACGDAPMPSEATAAPAPLSNVLSTVSDARMLDLDVALADARSRLLPAISRDTDAAATLHAMLQRLEERLAAEDAAGVMEAAGDVDAALATLPPAEVEVLMAELDALRLALGEVRVTVAGPTELVQ